MQGSLNQEISPPTPNIQNSLPPSHYNLMMNVGACQARGRVAVLVSGGGGPANLASNNPDTVSNGAEPRRCLPAATAPATDIISAAQHTTGRAWFDLTFSDSSLELRTADPPFYSQLGFNLGH